MLKKKREFARYYINPSNKCGFFTTAVVNTITTSAERYKRTLGLGDVNGLEAVYRP